MSDFAKFDRPAQLHVAFQALHEFASAHKRLPKPHNEADALAVLALAKTRAAALPEPVELSDVLVKQLAYTAAGSLPPMSSVIGGIVAQEVLKVRFLSVPGEPLGRRIEP